MSDINGLSRMIEVVADPYGDLWLVERVGGGWQIRPLTVGLPQGDFRYKYQAVRSVAGVGGSE